MFFSILRTTSALTASITFFTILTESTLAQDAQPDTDVITVTETRRAYHSGVTPMEAPEAIQDIGAAMLDQVGVLNLNQALDLSSSIARQNNFGGLWNSFAIRGFVGDENLPSGYLVNGFNAGRGFGGSRDISGIERIDVLKGPKAALLGRGEPGGTINLVTKRARFESEGEVNVSAGSFDTYRADGDWTGPISDNVAVRLTGFYEDANSFRETISTERYGATPSFLIKMGEDTRFNYEFEYAHQEVPFDRGILTVNGQLDVIPRERFLGEPGDGPMIADVLGHQAELQHDINESWSLLTGIGFRTTSLEGTSSEASLSGSRQRLLIDGETLTRQRRYRDYDADHFVIRAEVSGEFETAGLNHNVIIGTDYDRFENDQVFERYRAPSLASNPTLEQSYAINIFNPIYGQFALPEVGPQADRVEVQKAWSFYVQDQIEITEDINIRIGGRFDKYSQNLNNRRSDTQSSQSATNFSPQVGIVYEASDTLSFYSTYGEGFRPNSGADFLGNSFTPNRSDSIEVGTKFIALDGQLIGTLALFSIRQNNIVTSDPINAGFGVAIGEAKSQGVEFDLNGEIPGGINVWLSYSYVDAEVSQDLIDFNFGTLIEAGSPLLNIPEHTVNLQISKEFDIANIPVSFGGGVLHVSDRLGEAITDFTLPGYTLVNLFASFEPFEDIRIKAELKNLFDEVHYTNSFSQLWVQPGTPRSFRISGNVKF